MIFIIDSGSTKCDWIAIDPKTGHQVFEKQRTKGLNPAIISENEAFEIINENKILTDHRLDVNHVFFYGAGCGTVEAPLMLKKVLQSIFTNAVVDVKEDTYAAIFSTVGLEHDPAVVCIELKSTANAAPGVRRPHEAAWPGSLVGRMRAKHPPPLGRNPG